MKVTGSGWGEYIVSEFCGMIIDMDYILCIPSIHARYGEEDAVITYDGDVRMKSPGFPDERIELLRQWVIEHKDEIVRNHQKRGHGELPFDLINPPKTSAF